LWWACSVSSGGPVHDFGERAHTKSVGTIMIGAIIIIIFKIALLTGVTLVMIPVSMPVVGMLGLKRRACS